MKEQFFDFDYEEPKGELEELANEHVWDTMVVDVSDTIYLFYKHSAYDNEGESFIKKYDNDSHSEVEYLGLDDDPYPDGSYHDIFGGEAYGYAQYLITTNIKTILENKWNDDIKYMCTSEEIEKLKELKII